jgi:hypothetical protein
MDELTSPVLIFSGLIFPCCILDGWGQILKKPFADRHWAYQSGIAHGVSLIRFALLIVFTALFQWLTVGEKERFLLLHLFNALALAETLLFFGVRAVLAQNGKLNHLPGWSVSTKQKLLTRIVAFGLLLLLLEILPRIGVLPNIAVVITCVSAAPTLFLCYYLDGRFTEKLAE